jgi:Domain of unknown function (DUF4279)
MKGFILMAVITVRLFVESDIHSTEEMSSLIGVISNGGWRKGDLRGRTGRVYTSHSWKLTSRITVAEDIDEIEKMTEGAIVEILSKLDGRESQFADLARANISGFSVYLTSELLPPFICSADLLSRISKLGVDLEVCVAPH